MRPRPVSYTHLDVYKRQLKDGRLGVLIGDVADKGVPSALFMARAHALIMAEADIGLTAGDALRLVNTHITRLQKSTQFVTVLYGILDMETREFSYARAGHEPPLILHNDGSVEPVSYTHLDVYKRQMFTSAGSAGSSEFVPQEKSRVIKTPINMMDKSLGFMG